MYYPLGYLVGALVGYGIAYLLGARNDVAGFWMVLASGLAARLIHFRATGIFARLVGVFWVLVMVGFVLMTVAMLFYS